MSGKGRGPIWRFVVGDLVHNRNGDRVYVLRRNRDAGSKWRRHSMVRRAVTRWAAIAALCGVLVAYHVNPAVTVRAAWIVGLVCFLAAAGMLIYGVATYRHRTVDRNPLYQKIRSVYSGLRLPERPDRDRWQLARDGSTIRIRFDRGVAVKPLYRRQIHGIIEDHFHRDYSSSWRIDGPKPHATFTRRPYPQPREYAELLSTIEQLGPAEVLLGVSGSGTPAVWDMDNDAPHMMASVGTGGGKSSLVRSVVLQMLRKPDVEGIYIADVKWTSAKSLEGVEGVQVAKELPDVLAMVQHVARIIERRMRGVDDSTGRVLFVLEEGNLFTDWMTTWWQQTKPQQAPKRCPAFDALSTILYAGREFHVNCLALYQSGMVAAVSPNAGAAGGSSLRGQFGLTAVCRNTPQAWSSIVGGSDGPKQLRLPKGQDGQNVPGTMVLYRQTNQTQDIIGVPLATHEYTQAEALHLAGGATAPLVPVDPPRKTLGKFSTDHGDGMTGMSWAALRRHKADHPEAWAGLGRRGDGNSILYTALEVQDALRATGRRVGA